MGEPKSRPLTVTVGSSSSGSTAEETSSGSEQSQVVGWCIDNELSTEVAANLERNSFLEVRHLKEIIKDLIPRMRLSIANEALLWEAISKAKGTESSERTIFGFTSSSSRSGALINAKLPKLEIQKFDGDVSQWQQFWELFEANITQ